MGEVKQFISKQWKERFEKLGPMVSDNDVQKLIYSFLLARGEKGGNEQEVEIILDWAHDVVISSALLESVLSGTMLIDIENDEIVYKLSDEGKSFAEGIIEELDNQDKPND